MGNFQPQAKKCFCVDENIYFSYYNNSSYNECNLDNHNHDRYNWEEKKYYRNVFSPTSLWNEYTEVSGNIDENKELVVVAARINHLTKRNVCCRHVSVWLPVNRQYSKRQPLVFTRFESRCKCKYNKCKFCAGRHFGDQCKNENGSLANNIFFLPILN